MAPCSRDYNDTRSDPAMPAFGWQLNDAQIAAVATYVRNHWGKAPPVSEDEAKKERAQLDARTN